MESKDPTLATGHEIFAQRWQSLPQSSSDYRTIAMSKGFAGTNRDATRDSFSHAAVWKRGTAQGIKHPECGAQWLSRILVVCCVVYVSRRPSHTHKGMNLVGSASGALVVLDAVSHSHTSATCKTVFQQARSSSIYSLCLVSSLVRCWPRPLR